VAKLIVRGEVYDSVSAASLFESDYENLLLAHANVLYPSSHLVTFKTIVSSEYGSAMADLALIDRGYRKWWVVEVELSSHSLVNHVEPQVAALSTAGYGDKEAEYLSSRHAFLRSDPLREMMRGAPPTVLVLVDEPSPSWVLALRRWDAKVGVVKLFRSETNREVLLVDGEHPESLGDLVSECRVDPLMRQSLILESPANVRMPANGRLTIIVNGGVSEWRRVDSADRVWLMPIRRCPLLPRQTQFVLVRDQEGSLTLVNAG
jgi:hypothetical protein